LGTLLRDATWAEVNAVRDRVMTRNAESVESAAQGFVEDLVQSFSSIVLARIFLVLPLSQLPSAEQAYATRVAERHHGLTASTKVLGLLGTAGEESAWCDRSRSAGHLAIPLLDRTFVQGAPMIAKLLADLEVNLSSLDVGGPLVTRAMLGGLNKAFFVADALAAHDRSERLIIGAQDFVLRYGVRSVFGMGGAYVNGVLAIAIAFTSELLDEPTVNRFPSLIGNFKMATWPLCESGRIYSIAKLV
jgi:two-component system NtrC family sensor kinase